MASFIAAANNSVATMRPGAVPGDAPRSNPGCSLADGQRPDQSSRLADELRQARQRRVSIGERFMAASGVAETTVAVDSSPPPRGRITLWWEAAIAPW
jgi:hypothetical protein